MKKYVGPFISLLHTHCSFSVWVKPGATRVSEQHRATLSSEKLHYLIHMLTDLSHTFFTIIATFIRHSWFSRPFPLCLLLISHLHLFAIHILTFCFCWVSYFLYLIDCLSIWYMWSISWVLPLVYTDCPPHISIFSLWCTFILEHLFSIIPMYFLVFSSLVILFLFLLRSFSQLICKFRVFLNP